MVRDKAFYKTLLTLSFPAAVRSIMSLLINQTDGAMVASLGDIALAGVDISNRATAFFSAMVGGMVSGSAVLIAQYWGKGDHDRIRRIFAMVCQLCLAIALVVVLIISLFPNAVLRIITDNEAVIQAGLPYFRVICFSFLPYALTTAMVGVLRSVEVVRITLYITAVSLFTDIGLNYIFIFGKLGVPAMGVFGAGFSTVISRCLELSIVCWYTFRRQKNIALRPKDLLKGDRQLFKDFTRYGLPVGVGDTQWALVGFTKGAIVGRLGETMMAANSIADALMSLGMIFTSSLAGGASIIIGRTVGAKDYKRTRHYSNTIQILFLCIGATMALLVYLLRMPYTNLIYFNNSPEVKALATQLVAFAAFTLVGTTYHASCFVGINRGAGDSRFVFWVDLICGWLVVLPISYFAAFQAQWPLPVIYLCLRIDQCFKWLIAFTRLRGDRWIRNVTREDEAVKA